MHVVDSCGWLEYLADGGNASFFQSALENEAELLLPRIVVFEVSRRLMVLQRDHAIAPVLAIMGRLPLLDLSVAQLAQAAQAAKTYQLGMWKCQMFRLWRVLAGCSVRRKARRLALLNKRFATTQCARQCRQKWDIWCFRIP